MAEELLCSSLTSPLGPLLVALSTEGVCCVVFGGDMTAFTDGLAARSGATVRRREQTARLSSPKSALEAVKPQKMPSSTSSSGWCSEPPVEVALQFADYFAGRRKHFTLPLDYRFVTPFQQLVFDALLEVPAGQVVSYGELARRIGRPRASRGVGSALAHNPLPILVPCHRVVHRDGTLAGYSAGVHIKEYLLTLEGVMQPSVTRII